MAKADILIVDDTPTNLSLLTQMLTTQGYSVRAVTNGQRALESARTLPPDLILLDIRMPGVNGFDVCQKLKSDELTQDTPVIFISALDDIQDKVRGFKAGGVDYITKPFQLEEVLARTETHLAMRALQRQLQEANRKMATELTLAGQMQANFMPKRLPTPPGWQLSAGLKPARETSGDFFDVFQLPDGKLAILIADVVDKGVGAALFMAYTWSLIRTFADERPANPAWVYSQVNRRILADTGSEQFVTIFFAVLEPASGKLIYCNAGHLPPLLFRTGSSAPERRLVRTGIPLGVYDDQAWGTESVRMASGDLLVMYTDGTVDAVNNQEQNFGDKRLVATIGAALEQEASTPLQVQEHIWQAIQDYTAETRQFDDMALVLLQRS